jgi:uncharacterized protein
MAVFLTVFFVVYGLANLYLFLRGWQSIPPGSTLRSAYAVVFWLMVLSFIGGRLLASQWPSPVSDALVWIGSFWISAMLYFFLAVVLFDVLRLLNHFLPVFPGFITSDYAHTKYVTAAVTIGAVAVLLVAGHINALTPRLTRLDLGIDKRAPGLQSVNVVAVSDIHLGTIVGRSRLDYIVDRINRLRPDLVLLPGDIVDENLEPVIRQNLGEALRNIRAPLGIFAITGNHEYIGGVEEACRYLTAHNIVMLRDQATNIRGAFWLVGREDRSCTTFTGRQRKSLGELMAGVDRNRPVILMDHQPFGLEDAVDEQIDLQLSGHTHHGQLWPVSFIIKAIYEVGWGYRKIGATQFYVSNGVGTWGPPIRIGHRPEIVQIRLHFR